MMNKQLDDYYALQSAFDEPDFDYLIDWVVDSAAHSNAEMSRRKELVLNAIRQHREHATHGATKGMDITMDHSFEAHKNEDGSIVLDLGWFGSHEFSSPEALADRLSAEPAPPPAAPVVTITDEAIIEAVRLMSADEGSPWEDDPEPALIRSVLRSYRPQFAQAAWLMSYLERAALRGAALAPEGARDEQD